MAGKYTSIARLLAIIGAILYIYFGVMGIINSGDILGAIVQIIYGVVVLIAAGVIKSKKKVAFNGVLLLVIAILGFVWYGNMTPNILTLIAAILMFL